LLSSYCSFFLLVHALSHCALDDKKKEGIGGVANEPVKRTKFIPEHCLS
jgi:hypothetical protein